MNGTAAAATVVARKRSVFYGVLSYGVELDILPANPVGKVSWKAPESADRVDRRVVAIPAQVRQLLAAVDQGVGEAFSDGKDPGTSQMITGTAPNLFRHCSVNSRQKRGTAGNHRQHTTTAPGRVSLAKGRFGWWGQVLGSNQCRLSRRFYRPPAKAL
jgi:hypothetical protein